MKVGVPLPLDLSSMANGRTLRVVNLLRELKHRCEVSCLVPNDRRFDAAMAVMPDVPIEPIGPRREGCVDRQDAWPSDVLACSRWSRRALSYLGVDVPLVRETAGLAPSFDAILGFDVDSLAYLLAARQARPENGPRIVCDVIDDPWFVWRSLPLRDRLSVVGLKQAAVVRQLRRGLLKRCDALVVVSPQDADSLSAVTDHRVYVVPNGVWLPDEDVTRSARESLVVFTGAMQFPPNATAAEYLIARIWPKVLERIGASARHSGEPVSRVQLAIIGSSPSPRLCRMAERYGVLVTGWVEDVAGWLRRARVAVAPMVSGSGIKNKVLEASANACPVVATSLGVKGLPVGEPNGLLTVDDPECFAGWIAELITQPQRARIIGKAGRAMVSRQYAWPRMADQLLQILQGHEPGHPTQTSHESDATPKGHAPLDATLAKEAMTDASS